MGRATRQMATRDREERILAMRIAGATWAAIGAEVGLTPMGAFKACGRAMSREPVSNIVQLRRLEGERLDAMMLAAWPKAMDGSARHIEVLVKVSERRSKLFGLDAPEVKQVQVISRDAITQAIEELEEEITALGGSLD